jgi:hypothetical protein
MSARNFIIYLSTGETRRVSGTALRTALRNAEKEIRNAEIVGAMESACLPEPQSENVAFSVVVLKNPNYNPSREA